MNGDGEVHGAGRPTCPLQCLSWTKAASQGSLLPGLASMGDQLRAGLNVMKRLPPAQVEENLSALLNLAPDLSEELLVRRGRGGASC